MRAGIFSIAVCELRRSLLSPLAWCLFALFQFLLALVFFSNLLIAQSWGGGQSLAEGAIYVLFSSAGTLLLLTAPIFTMHLFSDEHRSGTMTLLLSSPLSLPDIVLGKYLGILGLLGCLLLLILCMPLSLLPAVRLQFQPLLLQALSFGLLAMPMAAIGIYASSLTARPMLAALGAFSLLVLLWLIELPRHLWSGEMAELCAYLSIFRHYSRLLHGQMDTADVLYFFLLSGFFLALTVRRLHNLRVLH